MKKIDPGKPKKINKLTSVIKNNLGVIKLIEVISVINLDLNLLLIASTKKKKLVDKKAWLINIQKAAKNR